jgi:hypothetical protein
MTVGAFIEICAGQFGRSDGMGFPSVVGQPAGRPTVRARLNA